jgi:Glycosyl hydrolase family 20, domain 2/Glycosyl hydrolase family 20, catalytic domain
MKDVTRRDFLQVVAGAAAAGAIIGHDPFLFSQAFGAAGKTDPSCGAECLPLDSLIFPKPQEISGSGSDFALDGEVRILVPANPSEQDLLLASLLRNEISDRCGIFLKTERVTELSDGKRAILMGSTANPLVKQYCSGKGLTPSTQSLGPEGYILHSNDKVVVVAGSDDRGAFNGFQSLRQLIGSTNKQVSVRGVVVRDWPDKHFRGITLYLPGRDNIQFFKRFISDFMALYKFNTVIVEMNACMRLDSHPELNRGWVEFGRDINYSALNYPPKPIHDMEQNSSHQDVADGAFLEKEEVADLARWISKHHIELVPQIPSFTHSYYLLTEHKDLAAVPENKWPDIYCPSNPKSYSLVFEVYDEYIEVLKPKMVHIGHDELFLPVSASPKCEDADIGELYGQDVKQIHDHLASKGVKTALWGDMLLQSVRGVGLQKKKAPDGWTYSAPGGLTREQVDRLIPKDCLIFNWFWADGPGERKSAEHNEAYLEEMGFQQIYGNFEPTIEHYETRKARATLLGGAPSAWYATNEYGFGKDMMSLFLGCGSILWTGRTMAPKVLSTQVQSMMPGIRGRLSGITRPSQTEASIVPLDISGKFNMGDTISPLGVSVGKMLTGTVQLDNIPFQLKNTNGMRAILVGNEGKQPSGLVKSVSGLPVGEAPTSLVFLHASAKPALNRDSVRLLWDQQDTADLLGWYEVVYQDGFVATIPVRYGVNILEWNWDERISEDDYCYNADPVAIGAGKKEQVTFFAFEWTNPRLGKVIQEIRLKGTTGFQGGSDDYSNDVGPVIASNAVILAALSVVRKRG